VKHVDNVPLCTCWVCIVIDDYNFFYVVSGKREDLKGK